ncbi:MAG: WHG domain-containing protein [Oscillospiraceae bacterium]|nr:WHG domain-containing protein [Oscillospiraceae bacterium]
MPPKAKIIAEMIAEAGMQLVRESGIAALNIRSVAKRLGCSTQPVMYHYHTAEALKAAVFAQADAFHTAFLMQEPAAGEEQLLGIGLRYIRFAAEECNLFRFLFQSGMLPDTPLGALIAAPENLPLLDAVAAAAGLTQKQAEDVFAQLFMTVHGCAALLANNALPYDAAYCEALLIRCMNGAVAAVKGEEHEEAL